jgi:NADPH-dependent 2,4-dienoyl-CoA reductase/sulfur reductase-like enzyme
MTDGQHTCDVVVVGGGPAGIAAACEAQDLGLRVTLLDQAPWLGGQVWRGGQSHPASATARRWLDRLERSGATVITQASVVAAPSSDMILAETPQRALRIQWRRLVLATGARELFIPFPGWTMPHVVGAGGLQTLVKGGWPIQGKRVVIAGSGPLLLAVAQELKKHGAYIRLIAEQTPWLHLSRFGRAVAGHGGKLLQGLGIGLRLLGVPYRCGWWPVRADGPDRVRRVTLSNGRRQRTLECDLLACAFGLIPNLELQYLLGCEIDDGFVRVDEYQQTTRSGVYCAGEPTGIGGVDCALVEGRIAGLSAAGQMDQARRLFPRRHSWHRFRLGLRQAFAVREELKSLATPETVVCRCEDVTLGQIRAYDDWRSAKLQTRCGMGACQGRTCGGATQFLFGWTNASVRPPILPVRVGTLMDAAVQTPDCSLLRKEHHEPSPETQSHRGGGSQASASHTSLH